VRFALVPLIGYWCNDALTYPFTVMASLNYNYWEDENDYSGYEPDDTVLPASVPAFLLDEDDNDLPF
jgi:hypothetical protein